MKFFRISLLLLFYCSVVFCANTYAQDEPPPLPPIAEKADEVVRIDTQLVDVPIVVTDKTGKPLRDLKQTNFVVYEDDKKQNITEFATTNAPFEVALLLDTSGSTRRDLRLVKLAAAAFIKSLRPGDKVSIVSFTSIEEGGKLRSIADVVIPLTDDRTKLQEALEKVDTSNGTPYYDSLLKIADTVFSEQPQGEFRGRRAIVSLTDGVDSTSDSDFEEVSERLKDIGVISYFIQVDTRDEFESMLLNNCATRFSTSQIRRYYRKFSRNARQEKVFDTCKMGDFERLDVSKSLYELADAEMKNLAKFSGGRVFQAMDARDARQAFIRVAEDIGTKYSLGYYSTNAKRDGVYRAIRIELKGVPAGAQIRAREGYTAPLN